ncbi:MAG: DUF4278 domain-containing protein [Elainella sp.]
MAITALLGLLLAGFVWMPWLVGVLLLTLLVALIKLSIDEPTPDGLRPESELGLKSAIAASGARRSVAPRPAPTQTGTGTASASPAQNSPAQNSPAPIQSPKAPGMVYRGVKYQRPKAVADASNQKGLYRGQPWQR